MTDAPTTERRIEHRPLADLKPDPKNPKNHSEETIDASIGRFGFTEPVVLDGRTGYIISGHGRTKVLTTMEQRGESPPEGIKVDESGRWLVPTVVGWSSRTDSEAAAALIALNRTTELGGWVDEALLDLLDDLSEMDDGLAGVGFDEDALDDLAASLSYADALDDLAGDGLGEGAGGGHSAGVPADDSSRLTFNLHPADRDEVVRWLNAESERLAAPTSAATLLALAREWAAEQ